MKKLFTLLLVGLTIYLIGCKKEEVNAEYISGYIYEEGTGKPIKNANITLIASDDKMFPDIEPVAMARTDNNGAFRIKNARHTRLPYHYLMAQAFGYYELKEKEAYRFFPVHPGTSYMDVRIVKSGTLTIELIKDQTSFPASNRKFVSRREYSLSSDTLFQIKVNVNTPDTLVYSRYVNGKSVTDIIPIYVVDPQKDKLQLFY